MKVFAKAFFPFKVIDSFADLILNILHRKVAKSAPILDHPNKWIFRKKNLNLISN